MTSTLLPTEHRVKLIRVWDAMFKGARKEVEDRGFIGVHNMPEIVGITGACENVDTLFKVDYFGKQAYLAQSDQLYLEMLTPHLEKVYAEIQSFRMEPEADDRHLTQFSLFEIEHLGTLDELMDHIEAIVRSAVESAREVAHLGLWDTKLRNYLSTPFKRMTYTEAVKWLRAVGHTDLEWGDDLLSRHESSITNMYGPTFVTHYPIDIKFWNMRTNENDPTIVNSCDLLLPKAGESAGAAERQTEYDSLVDKLKSSHMYRILTSQGVKDEDFEWYLEAHRGADIPLHSGAGIGMARVAQFILGVDDIRDAVPFVINSENLL